MSKEENLFALSNVALKDRLRAEGIAYKENATKRELVALLNGDAKAEETVEGAVAEENAAAAESTLSMDSVEESVNPDSSISGEAGSGDDGATLSVDEHVGVDSNGGVDELLKEKEELQSKLAANQLAIDKAATLHGHIDDLKTPFN